MSHGMKHGSESFFIEGEGLLTTQLGGRTGDEPDPVTESDNPKPGKPRELAADTAPPFRFSRVGPQGQPPERHHHQEAGPRDGRRWGRRREDPGRLHLPRPVRRPRPDHGPDPGRARRWTSRPRRCSRTAHRGSTSTRSTATAPATPGPRSSTRPTACTCKTGTTIPAEGVKAKPLHDLPRVGKGGVKAAQQALIPDPRNDENLIVAQTHNAMICFHNKVVDKTSKTLSPAQRFAIARKRVTLHYQWLLRHDYLPRILRADHPQRRVHEGSQAGRAGRHADRRTDDADRVLGRRVPAGAQHDPRGVQLELPLPRHRRDPGLDVHLLRAGRRPRSASVGCSAAGSPTGAGCTTSPPAASRSWPRPTAA